MKRVVVTGASGFVGRHTLNPLLEDGYEVFALSRNSLEGFPGVSWIKGDLFNDEWRSQLLKTIQPTHLLHCAWYTEHGKFWRAPENLDWLAVSIQLIREFQDCGGQRVVVAGTCAEYDWNLGNQPLRESDLTNPSTLYGESKLALWRVLAKFAQETGLSYGWGRIFWVFGAGEPEQKLISSLVKALNSDQVFVCNSGELIRDFICVEDVGKALVKILSCDVQGAINVASGQPLKIGDMVHYLAQEMQKPKLVEIHSGVASPASICADISILTNQVGYTPENIYLSLKNFLLKFY